MSTIINEASELRDCRLLYCAWVNRSLPTHGIQPKRVWRPAGPSAKERQPETLLWCCGGHHPGPAISVQRQTLRCRGRDGAAPGSAQGGLQLHPSRPRGPTCWFQLDVGGLGSPCHPLTGGAVVPSIAVLGSHRRAAGHSNKGSSTTTTPSPPRSLRPPPSVFVFSSTAMSHALH